VNEPTKIDSLSLATTRIEMLCNHETVGPASGFYYRKDSELYLVSNWHVFSGRHPSTGQPLHPSCAPTESISFNLFDDSSGKIVPYAYEFHLKDESDVSIWWQHPDRGQLVDIGVLKVPKSIADKQKKTAELPNNSLSIRVGQDVFVLGYPRGLALQFGFPVWKRGSIASEPHFDVGEESIILIDTSRDPYQRDDGSVGAGNAARLLGVYSGRTGKKEEQEIQLGRCWKAALIDEIIAGRKAAT
jgi:Trypsin-like peptidase domain